jgi:DNA-binding transcriptional LysR family regulator
MQRLFRSVPVGAACSDHPLFRGRVTAKKYAACQHVNASRRGLSYTPIDAELEKLNLKRRISLVVPSFQTAIVAAAHSRLVASIPQYLSRSAESSGLRVFAIPVPVHPVTIFQVWHPRFGSDPAHQFLRECVRRICSRLSD